MKNVVIVGPEGSGKTVMLAGLGVLYARPDAEGYYLEPLDRTTYVYVSGLVHEMRNGRWPAATETDAQKQLTWNLRQRDGSSGGKTLCRISFLDFAGEIYRDAFGQAEGALSRQTGAKRKSRGTTNASTQTPVEERALLRARVRKADVVFVLVNLSDVISGRGGLTRATEIEWAAKSILDYIYASGRSHHTKAVLVLSQVDAYRDIIEAAGGPRRILEKYLPVIWSAYGHIEVITASSVDRTRLDDDGGAIPDIDFSFDGLKIVVDVLLREIVEAEDGDSSDGAAEDADAEESVSGENQDGAPWDAGSTGGHAAKGFAVTIIGAILVAIFLWFISLVAESLSTAGPVVVVGLWFWLLSGLGLFFSGVRKMAHVSIAALMGTLVLIATIGIPVAQAIRNSDFIRGLNAFFGATTSAVERE